jgi:2-desacetyl-2-hydroxyethyl bacteriochlorophyllide A dehydrogenase
MIRTAGQVEVTEIDPPTPGPHDVLIDVKAAGICGTDLHILHGEYMAQYPLVPGHEFSGRVAAVGANVTRFKVGDRVTADPNLPCHGCEECQRNHPNQCLNMAVVGVTRAGAFAEQVSVPESSVFGIGDLSYAAGALVEPLACVVWGLQRVQVQPGDTALVFGAGPMGCLIVQALLRAGASQVVVTDTVPARLETASALGASEMVLADDSQAAALHKLAPQGFDIVTDATGLPAVLETAFDHARARGKVWVFGVAPQGAKAAIVPYDVFRKDLTIIGSFAVNRTFHQSIALIQAGAVRVEPLVSHRLPLSDFARGMEMAEHAPDRMKIQFTL